MRCSVCRHPDRVEIEKAIIAGTKYAEISKKYGVTAPVLSRHKQICMSEALVTVLEANNILEPERYLTIYDEMIALKDKAEAIYQTAEEEKNTFAMLAALKEIRGVVLDMAKLSLIQMRRERAKEKRDLPDSIREMLDEVVHDAT